MKYPSIDLLKYVNDTALKFSRLMSVDIFIFAVPLTHGVIGNTTDFGSVESRFEP